ncbi:MAG: hypothetical protein K1X78_21080 [Verrucomicrobiaceae bacterium]|nr:hypothetical protein [Verrucomicrobiaceae bacterium]
MNSTTDLLFSLHARFPGLMEIAISLAKGVAIICLMWALALLLRHRSAVARAWVWRCGFVALLLLAAWPYRPMVVSALTLVVNVPTEAVVVSHSAVRVKPVMADEGIVDAKAPPLVIEKDTSAAAVAQRLLRKLDPWTVTAWWMGFVALLGIKMSRARIGVRHLHRNSRQASREVQEACASIANVSAAAVVPEVRFSSVIGSPLLTGSRRAVIWLPDNSAEWSEAKLEAVLHHEIAHLARRDGRWQWIATAAACFWWWNPAVWFALARLKAEAEQAADEVVVTRKISASDYAQALIEIASTWLPRAEPALGVPMLGMSEIERRVRELLRDHPWRGRFGAMATSAIAMLAVMASGIVLVSCKQQPAAYISIAKLVAGGRMGMVGAGSGASISIQYQDYLQDFYGTIIETLESSEMRRRALDRVRALHPEMKELDVSVEVRQNKGSAVFNVVATGQEPKYTRIFLDALLDEFIAFRNQIREQQRNKALTTLAEDVVRREKSLQDKQDKIAAFQKANNVVALTQANNYLAQALVKLRGEREEQLATIDEISATLENLSAGLRQRERTARHATSAAGTGLTRLEDDFLEKEQALFTSRAELAFTEKKKGPADAKTIELTEAVERQEVVLKKVEDQIKIETKLDQQATEKRADTLEKLIKVREAEAQDVAGKLAEHDKLKKDYEDSKKAYDEILDLVRRFTVGEDMTSDHVTIMERASGAVEEVRGWFGSSSSKMAGK